jgi:hypothetical protein
VAEQDRLRCDSFEKNLKLIEVVGHADPKRERRPSLRP